MEDLLSSFLADYQVVLDSSVSLPPSLAERYTLVDCLRGSDASSTFLVKNKADGSLSILKVAAKRAGRNLLGEYQILDALDSPAFPKALFYQADDHTEFFLRGYIPGTPISDYIEQYGPLSERETIRIGIGFCDTLSLLHRQNPPVIHRDIKPQNLIYTREHGLALIDFDAARHYQPKRRSDTVCLGTQTTAAPEQFGYKQTDQRSDIYSTGVLLLYFCTGSYDLEGCASLQNRKLARVIETCTQFDPERRYANIRQLQSDLRFAAKAQSLPKRLFLRGTGIGLAAGFGLAVLLGAVGVLPQQWSSKQAVAASVPLAEPSPAATNAVVTFESPEIEHAVRVQLGMDETTPLTQADLDRVTKLYFFGEATLDNWNDVSSRSLYNSSDPKGTIQTLTDISKLRNLAELAVCNQAITDLSPLRGMNLVRLAVGGNFISNLSPLQDLPYLKELYIGYNPIVETSALQNCSGLRVLDLCGTNIIDLSTIDTLALQSLYVSDTLVNDYSMLVDMTTLERLSVNNSNEQELETISQISNLTFLDYRGTAPDIAPLLRLEKLTGLMLFDQQITNLEGIETLSNLNYLLVDCTPGIDLVPLTKLPRLASLDIFQHDIKDYTFLFRMQKLNILYCSSEQKTEIEATGQKANFEIVVLR